MKRTLLFLLVALSLVLAACSGGQPQPPTAGGTGTAPTEAPTAGPTEAPTAGPAHTTCEGTNDSFSPALTYNVADGKDKTYKWTTTANVKVTCNNGQPKFEVITITSEGAPVSGYIPGVGFPKDQIPEQAPLSLETVVKTPEYHSGKCPTDGDMQKAFGFDARGIKPVNTSTESDLCKWTLQAVSPYVFEKVPFLADWQLTVTLNDKYETVAVYYGDGISRDIKGATLAYLPAYPKDHWRWNANELMSHEFHYGFIETPYYVTVNGNTDADKWLGYTGASCPANTTQTAGLVGGSSFNWTAPDWSGGAWVFKSKTYITLWAPWAETYNAWIDYDNGGKLEHYETLGLINASLHCEPVKPVK